MDKYTITYARVMGRDHLSRQMNRQDALRTIETDKYVVGVVSDGCGSGHFSEVGANLIADYVVRRTVKYLQENTPLQSIPNIVASDLIHALRSTMIVFDAKDQDVYDYLLATINGIILDKETGAVCIFNNGDGVLVIDNYVHEIDQKNTPKYLSYGTIHDQYEMFNVYMRTKWQRVGVFTDGIEIDKIDKLFTYNSPLQLQRQLNALSKYNLSFKDDLACFLISKKNSNE